MTVHRDRSIQVLPQSLVARIAAGEVITRPRAAVKELIDNAIDAGATRIDVEITSGGYDRIAVHDDGHGIPSADAPLVFARHATSKLPADGALDVVDSLGFRGEALASLAAVAQVEIRTRHAGERVGARIACGYGGDTEVAWIARQMGSSVEARGLFLHSPVRRRSVDPASEARSIRRLVGQYAIAYPSVAFRLQSEGRLTLQTPGGSLEAAFDAVYGDDMLRSLLEIGPLAGDWFTVHGLVTAPGASRSNRDGIVLLINGRLCSIPDLQRAVERAYGDVLPRQRFPYVALFVTVDSGHLDVNVHPAKERVIIPGVRVIAERLEREIRAVLGRTAHRVAEKRSLALELGALPGLRAAETGPEYLSGGWGARVVEAGTLPRLRVVGHVEDTLIVCESDLGTLLIDQHRAHERVIFERLLASEPVPLDEPVTLALSPEHYDLLDQQRDDLHAAGWRVHDLGAGQIHVGAAPPDLAPDDLSLILERYAVENAHSVLAASACHAAIRKRRPITPEAAVELLEALTATTTPTTCPHGQPIVINLDRAFLERQFDWR